MRPEISVVIPLYNKKSYIVDCLNSVLQQHTLPKSIIVIDDGSTDESGDAVLKVHHPLIQLVRQKNLGVSCARNLGVTLAATPYIAFLDADDYWEDNHLCVLSEVIQKNPGKGLYSTLHKINLNGVLSSPMSPYPIGFIGAVDDFYFRFSCGLSLVNSSSACVEKEKFFLMGGFPIGVKRGEDIIVWCKLASNFGMGHASIPTAVYNRAVSDSASCGNDDSIPPALSFLKEEISKAKYEEKRSILSLYKKISFYTAAGFRERGNIVGVKKILLLSFELNQIRLSALLCILFFTPSIILSWLRKIRYSVYRVGCSVSN